MVREIVPAATPIREVELRVIDVIVSYITSGYYDHEAKTKYFDDKGMMKEVQTNAHEASENLNVMSLR